MAWHWQQTDSWYYTLPGTKKRVPLFDEDGNRIRGADNKEAANLALARVKLGQGWRPEAPPASPDDWLVAKTCSEYLQYCERGVANGSISQGHRDSTKSMLNDLCKFCGALPVTELKKGHIKTWMESHEGWKSPATYRNAFSVILAAFNYAEDNHDIPNPLKGLKKPPARPRLQSFSKEDEKALYKATDKPLRAFLSAGPRAWDARAESIAYSAQMMGSLYVNATLLHPIGRRLLAEQMQHLARLGDLPRLAELAPQVAPGRREREDACAGIEMVQWFFLDTIDAKARAAAIGVQHELPAAVFADKAKARVAVFERIALGQRSHTTRPLVVCHQPPTFQPSAFSVPGDSITWTNGAPPSAEDDSRREIANYVPRADWPCVVYVVIADCATVAHSDCAACVIAPANMDFSNDNGPRCV